MNSEILADAIVTQRHAKRLYDFGFIGIRPEGIQVTKECFSSIKDLGELTISARDDDYYPYEACIEYRGVKFLTIGTVLEFDAIGINVL